MELMLNIRNMALGDNCGLQVKLVAYLFEFMSLTSYTKQQIKKKLPGNPTFMYLCNRNDQ